MDQFIVVLLGILVMVVVVVGLRQMHTASINELMKFQSGQRQELMSLIDSVIAVSNDKVDTAQHAVGAQFALQSQAVSHEVAKRDEQIRAEVNEVRTSLQALSSLLADLRTANASHHSELVTHFHNTHQTFESLASVTSSLRDALSNPKSRGSWGERCAEDILRSMGMIEGVSFLRQQRLPGGTQPDFTFLLPGGKRVHMDVKFPADNYLRMLEATNEVDRKRFLKLFLADSANRIKELSGRGYIQQDETLEFVILFVPNEAVYATICEHGHDILSTAIAQRVVLCAPYGLLGVLSIVRQSVETLKLEQRTSEILSALEVFRDEWGRYADQLDKVEKHFATVHRSFGELNGPRRNQLRRRLNGVIASGDMVDDANGDTIELPTVQSLGDAEGHPTLRSASVPGPTGIASGS